MPGMIQPKREVSFSLVDGSAAVKVWPIMGGEPKTQTMQITRGQWEMWQDGAFIQDAMPHLTDTEREFLLTGIDADEWNKMFPPEND